MVIDNCGRSDCIVEYRLVVGKNPPYYTRIQGSLDKVLVRKTVAGMLVRANEVLKSFNLHLIVMDAYRPIAVQQGLWEFFSKDLSLKNPELDHNELRELVARYVSDPSITSDNAPLSVPSHATGGSVDVVLGESWSGCFADLGSQFDEMNARSATDYYERLLQSKKITENDKRLRLRRILHNCMRSVGFTNYFAEYWHYDWGNQAYIKSMELEEEKGLKSAWYGHAEPQVRQNVSRF